MLGQFNEFNRNRAAYVCLQLPWAHQGEQMAESVLAVPTEEEDLAGAWLLLGMRESTQELKYLGPWKSLWSQSRLY